MTIVGQRVEEKIRKPMPGEVQFHRRDGGGENQSCTVDTASFGGLLEVQTRLGRTRAQPKDGMRELPEKVHPNSKHVRGDFQRVIEYTEHEPPCRQSGPAGLGRLSVSSREEYQSLAIRIAGSPGELRSLKEAPGSSW